MNSIMRVLFVAIALVMLCAAISVQAQSSQTLQIPHELHEHELTDHYGDGKDPRFDSGETDPAHARDEGNRGPLHPPSAASGYYPPPPPPAPPSPPSAKHAESKLNPPTDAAAAPHADAPKTA